MDNSLLSHMKTFALLFLVTIFFVSCSTPKFFEKKEKKEIALRFYLEAANPYPGQQMIYKMLPLSGIQVPVYPVPILSEELVFNAELVQLPQGLCALFQLNETGGRILYRTSVNHRGSRIIFEKDGVTLGSFTLMETMAQGNLFIFTEMNNEDLTNLILTIREDLNPEAFQGAQKEKEKSAKIGEDPYTRRNQSK